ncbi:hypothetical protein G3I35_39165, partial [Streptomyces sp. SID10815]|nr:hypothetical protein [Streptomyces sp. SID10815]
PPAAVAEGEPADGASLPEAPALPEASALPEAPVLPEVPAQHRPDLPVGHFVPVEGSAPRTPRQPPAAGPHDVAAELHDVPARQPAAPHAEAEPLLTVPAPRDGDSVPATPGEEPAFRVVQHADDPEARAAGQ